MDNRELPHLMTLLTDLTRKVAGGKYDSADQLFELTTAEKYPPIVRELAESFGMMLVQVEAREFRLEQMISDLAAKNRELESTLARLRLLESVRDQLSKFVPNSVLSLIEDNPENPDFEKHDEDITILFLDIAGYTRMSERIEQGKINHLIQTYFSSFLDAILENKGDINETAGDGLMIIFRDEDRNAHPRHALQSAIGIRHRTALINEAQQKVHEPVVVNMGINTGVASIGSSRFECLSGARWTYTAMGPVTNLAARISSLATEGSILVGQETYQRVSHAFRFEQTGPHHLKNVSKPVWVYRVL